MHRHVAFPLLHSPPVLLLRGRRKKDQNKRVSLTLAWNGPLWSFPRRGLTSTSAAPGSLLKHMVMVLRAILKKFVKDTDFPCEQRGHWLLHGPLRHGSASRLSLWRRTNWFFFYLSDCKNCAERLRRSSSTKLKLSLLLFHCTQQVCEGSLANNLIISATVSELGCVCQCC